MTENKPLDGRLTRSHTGALEVTDPATGVTVARIVYLEEDDVPRVLDALREEFPVEFAVWIRNYGTEG